MTLSPSTLLLALIALNALLLIAVAALAIVTLRGRRAREEARDEAGDALVEALSAAQRDLAARIAQTDARLTAGINGLVNYVAA